MARNGQRKMILLGLSEGNLMRLREKKPIHINGEELDRHRHRVPGAQPKTAWPRSCA